MALSRHAQALVGACVLLAASPVARAYSAARAQPTANRAATHGPQTQGYLGIMFHDVSDGTVSSQHLKDKRGAEIVMVDHDGPAGKAGLREHDVVLSLNGATVESEDQLRKMLHEMQPGRTITMSIYRDGSEKPLTATLSTREEVERQARLQRWTVPVPVDDTEIVPDPAPGKSGGVFSHGFMAGHLLPLLPVYTGATVDPTGSQLAEYFGVKDGNGLLVHAVEGNSPAASAGLRAGDVITRMNGGRVNTEKEWTRALRESRGKAITLTVVRERREQTLTMIADGRKRSAVEIPAEPGNLAGQTAMFR